MSFTPAILRLFVLLIMLLPGWNGLAQSATESGIGTTAPLLTDNATTASKRRLKPSPGVIIRQDVVYLEPHREEKLDLYLPADRGGDVKSPAILIIHGGGWAGGVKDAAREYATGTTLAKAGYVCASVEYMKNPGERWPTNLLDCKNAVRYVRKNARELGIDPDRIGVIGGSAGGHLALMVAYTSGIESLEPEAPYPGIPDHVSACVNMYGITNLLTRKKTEKDGTPTDKISTSTSLFPVARDADPELWKFASPVSHVRANNPPTLILHGSADTTVDRDQAVELAQRLTEAGAPHEFHMIPGAPHSFHFGGKALSVDIKPLVLDFFDKHLRK